MILLDEITILEQIKNFQSPYAYELNILKTVDSTNNYLKRLPSILAQNVVFCCAEEQTQGKGRLGRAWHSPFGESIYCSCRFDLHTPISQLSSLSLVISLSVVEVLKTFNDARIQIKWPNDILYEEKKLGGILIETIPQDSSRFQVIIGIGLNINSRTQGLQDFRRPWCSLYDIIQKETDRNLIMAMLIQQILTDLHQFISQGFCSFYDKWSQYDYIKGKNIEISQANTTFSGLAQGIDSTGQLLVADKAGKVHAFFSGDASIIFT